MAKKYPHKGATGGQCPDCSGSGSKRREVQRTDSKGKTTTQTVTEDCRRCGGTGSV